MSEEPTIGTGRNGQRMTAREIFAEEMAETQAEWDWQATDPERPADLTEDNWEAYKQARLIGRLNALLCVYAKIPK